MHALVQHWQTQLAPLQGHRWPIRCGHVFTPAELARLREGLWPSQADDRWANWLDGGVLPCWRSGTRTCVYEARIVIDEDGTGTATMLDVLDDEIVYSRSASEIGELDRFEGVVQLALSHRSHTTSDDDGRD